MQPAFLPTPCLEFSPFVSQFQTIFFVSLHISLFISQQCYSQVKSLHRDVNENWSLALTLPSTGPFGDFGPAADLPTPQEGNPCVLQWFPLWVPRRMPSQHAYTPTLKGRICREAPSPPPRVWIHKKQRAPSGCHQPIPMQSVGCCSQGAGVGGGEATHRMMLTKPRCLGHLSLQSSLLGNCR